MSVVQKLKPRPLVARKDSPSASYDLFVAAPMSGLGSRALFAASRDTILAMIDAISADTGLQRVYYAGKAVNVSTAFTEGEDALDQDLGALRRSKALLLVYPEKIATGALVELGFALGLRMKVAILVRDHDDLPYFLRHLRGAAEPATTGKVVVLKYAADADLPRCAIQALGLLNR